MKEIAALDPATMADEELSEAVVEMARLRAALEAAEVQLTAQWDSRRVWSGDGAKSGAAWLATKTREPKGDCGRRLWLGRKLADMRAVAAAWAAGDIGAAHVRRLAQAHNRRTARLFERDEAALVHHAMTLSFAEFSQALDYWSLYADPDGAEQNDIDRRDRQIGRAHV